MENKKLILGLPKGSLQENSLLFLSKAGFNINLSPRTFRPEIDDPEINCFLLRAQEIPKYVSSGKLDAGIAGSDWIFEQKAKVKEVCVLDFAKKTVGKAARWVLAVPRDSSIKTVYDLQGKTVASEVVGLTKNYLRKKGVKAKVEFSWGASEAKPPLLADAVVDITETGESLRANNLKVIDNVFESRTKFIASPQAWKNSWKRKKIETMALLICGRVKSHQMTNIMAHVYKERLNDVLRLVQKYSFPAVKKIADTDYFALSFRCQKEQARELIPTLKRAGCQGIVQSIAFKID